MTRSKPARKRGMTALLQDVTNTVKTAQLSCRQSKVEAKGKIREEQMMKRPRGDSLLGAQKKWSNQGGVDHRVQSDGTSHDKQTVISLRQLLDNDYERFSNGCEHLSEYVERNTPCELNKALALKVFQTAILMWGEGVMEASQRAADVSGNSVWSVRKWAADYHMSLNDIPSHEIDDDIVETILLSNRGKSVRNPHSIIRNEEFYVEARQYVRENANRKGEPNLTSDMFKVWVNKKYDCSICAETARKWLHTLGFKQANHTKGVYFDGHERDDVVKYRSEFLDKLEELDRRCIYDGHSPSLFPGEKPLIQIHHDESTFFANADQKCYWADGSTAVLKQKRLGQSIMVSDFIEECSTDYLNNNGSEARLLLEAQSEGYFDSDKLLEQVDKAIDIFECKHPHAQGLFLFDNAPSHKKCSNDTLNVSHMNVRDGGKQPIMRDTVWNGEVQKMVNENCSPKGMRTVLEERGVDTKGMNASKLREVLGQHPDFRAPRTILEEQVEERGHICMFFPKFHCELNAIERCWCHAKKYTRQYANGSIIRLRKIVPKSLETCTPDLISKYFKTCRDYMKAYRGGYDCTNVDAAVKVYKSHRRVPDKD